MAASQLFFGYGSPSSALEQAESPVANALCEVPDQYGRPYCVYVDGETEVSINQIPFSGNNFVPEVGLYHPEATQLTVNVGCVIGSEVVMLPEYDGATHLIVDLDAGGQATVYPGTGAETFLDSGCGVVYDGIYPDPTFPFVISAYAEGDSQATVVYGDTLYTSPDTEDIDPDPEPDPGTGGPQFIDSADSIFGPEIEALGASGITKGCNPEAGNTMFCPEESVTRGQMAAFLVRALGLPGGGNADPFTDDDDSVFEADIEALAAAGITKGVTETEYNPYGHVTRGQMAAFLRRALGDKLELVRDAPVFYDIDDSVFSDDIIWLFRAGITDGSSANTFSPDSEITRGQMAKFLTRAFNLEIPEYVAEMVLARSELPIAVATIPEDVSGTGREIRIPILVDSRPRPQFEAAA